MPISGLLSALAKHSYIPARLSKTITDERSVLLVDGGALKHRLWRDCGAPPDYKEVRTPTRGASVSSESSGSAVRARTRAQRGILGG